MMTFRFSRVSSLAGLFGIASAAFLATGAQAAPCTYDLKAIPSVTGDVSRVTPQGILLTDGTEVLLPESLLPRIRLDHEITARGLHSLQGHRFLALALQEGNNFICPSNADVEKGPYPGSSTYDIIDNDEEQPAKNGQH
ncbi:hypothetical protein PT277_08515 [Acetobacteraceae bacterium ESL0709]|nr:hypothetical protein [Acetobacteraceae bacterium ESL0697]MDF7678725.1 hypothetical protein [Acetobacteraceae bacterium ESL0709]